MTIQGAIAELQALINADDVPFYYKGGIKKVIETIQMDLPIEPKRPRGTETMIVDGEPMEIDPLSYEVGYTHGQFKRPKGEWVGEADGYWNGELIYDVWYCPFCDYRIEEEERELLPHYCPNCGADMRGDNK